MGSISAIGPADVSAKRNSAGVLSRGKSCAKLRTSIVMAGLVPAIHAFARMQDVDARDKRGHDESGSSES